MSQRLSRADIQDIQRLAREGSSVAEIVRATGVANSTVRSVMIRYGFDPKNRKRGINRDAYKRLVELRQAGWTANAIAKETGFKESTISTYFSRWKVAATEVARPVDDFTQKYETPHKRENDCFSHLFTIYRKTNAFGFPVYSDEALEKHFYPKEWAPKRQIFGWVA